MKNPSKNIHRVSLSLTMLSVLFFLAAFAFIAYASVSVLERKQFGPGPMFADIEVFMGMSLASGSAGGFVLFLARRLSGKRRTAKK